MEEERERNERERRELRERDRERERKRKRRQKKDTKSVTKKLKKVGTKANQKDSKYLVCFQCLKKGL